MQVHAAASTKPERDTRGYRANFVHVCVLESGSLGGNNLKIVWREEREKEEEEEGNTKRNLPFGVVNFNGELPVAKVQVFQLFPLKYLEKKKRKKHVSV